MRAIGVVLSLFALCACSADATSGDGEPSADENLGDSSTGGTKVAGSGGATATGGAKGTGGGTGAGGTTGSGGATATGGATGSGGTTGGGGTTGSGGATGTGGADGGPPRVTGPCPTEASSNVGVWEDITPPGFYWANAMVLDPVDPRIVYVGGSPDKATGKGIYRSSDCGMSWNKINTGANGAELDKGSQWVLLIDPTNPKVLYANSGYGVGGIFKSTNGGVDWAQTYGPSITDYVPYGGFTSAAAMDPADPQHILASFHAECGAPYTKCCYGETTDGGATWKLVSGDPSWAGGEGTTFEFIDSTHLLFSSQSNGMWQSFDSGKTWTVVPGASTSHAAGELYRAANGSIFKGSGNGVMWTKDGTSWSLLSGSGTLIVGVVGDGTHVYSSNGYPYTDPKTWPAPYNPYRVADEANPSNWQAFGTAKMISGGTLRYSPEQHMLYASNMYAGVYRLQLQ